MAQLTGEEQVFKKKLLAAIETYWRTRNANNPHGDPVALKSASDTYEEFKQMRGTRSMPSHNKLGYSDKRDKLNASIAYYKERNWEPVKNQQPRSSSPNKKGLGAAVPVA